jgi:hypothetical protein
MKYDRIAFWLIVFLWPWAIFTTYRAGFKAGERTRYDKIAAEVHAQAVDLSTEDPKLWESLSLGQRSLYRLGQINGEARQSAIAMHAQDLVAGLNVAVWKAYRQGRDEGIRMEQDRMRRAGLDPHRLQE